VHGYQLTFFTQQDRRHGGLPLAQWLIEEARQLGLAGATMFAAAEGFGHQRKLHSAHFFELADQPIEVTMAVSSDDAERIFARLRDERVDVFYTLAAIEYGMSSERSG
jgi:PII-like signaling protein